MGYPNRQSLACDPRLALRKASLRTLSWVVIFALPATANAADKLLTVSRFVSGYADAVGNINVGGTYSIGVIFECRDIIGQRVDDTVTLSVTGAPDTGGAVSMFDPNPVQTFNVSNFSVSTTKKTEVKLYNMNVLGQGVICGAYPPLTIDLTVKPILNGSKTLWWFNGEMPPGYSVKTSLTAAPTDAATYLWKIKAGADKVEFSNKSSRITTTSAATPIMSKSSNGSSKSRDIKVTVTVNNIESDPFRMTVLVPNSLIPQKKGFTKDEPDKDYGYKSTINYVVLDQMGDPLPAFVPLNEEFTRPLVKDYIATDWRRGPDGGTTQNPRNIQDEIQGEVVGFGLNPEPQTPQMPLGKVKIEHWNGRWQIGSTTVGKGRTVQTNVWQKYRDHGRHENIVSPPP
jgi:hypothetical protein